MSSYLTKTKALSFMVKKLSLVASNYSEGNNMNQHQFSCSVVSGSLWPHGQQHARPPCPSPTPGACSNSCPLRWWCPPTIYIHALQPNISLYIWHHTCNYQLWYEHICRTETCTAAKQASTKLSRFTQYQPFPSQLFPWVVSDKGVMS